MPRPAPARSMVSAEEVIFVDQTTALADHTGIDEDGGLPIATTVAISEAVISPIIPKN